MAIDFNKTFGAGNKAGNVSNDDRPKAQLWLNIGYQTDIADEDGKLKFVSLPVGIPLDTQEPLPTNSKSDEFRAFQSARNDLMTQMINVGKSLGPGEEKIIALGDSGLSIQIRRVSEEAAAVPSDQNQFARKLNFG